MVDAELADEELLEEGTGIDAAVSTVIGLDVGIAVGGCCPNTSVSLPVVAADALPHESPLDRERLLG